MKAKNFISKNVFKTIKPGDKLILRFMIGECYAIGKPVLDETDVIKVRFDSGPWTKKNNGEYKLIRQQIARVN
ncbi:MAG: hypothetical protein ACW98K_00040 [Candidatus Kariarchaeaceae archaeon]|jgi:hypothetical protein